MLFLSEPEKDEWASFAGKIERGNDEQHRLMDRIRPNLRSAFCFYIGTLLAARGQGDRAVEWLRSGAMEEEEGLFSCTFLLGFLERHDRRMVPPDIAFRDPRPFIHFANVPVMKNARERFTRHFIHTLPVFENPVKLIDLGCGDGRLTLSLLKALLDCGKAPAISEVLLVDSSPAMIELARETVCKGLPGVVVRVENARIQDCLGRIDSRYDIAISSLAYHHMPVEQKEIHLKRLKPWIDHFVLFEMDANNDTPDIFTPDLSFSVYQSYGRIIDFVYAFDAPVDIVTNCVDSFLMTEMISILTEPRGTRSDYHMRRNQWLELFDRCLSPEFGLMCDSACYSDEYVGLFSLHYGRRTR